MHWSQFPDNPLYQNPGNVGKFDGDLRATANFRDQWRSVTVPFQSLALGVDSRFEKNKKIGYGVQFNHDVAGDGQFRTVEFNAMTNYQIELNNRLYIYPGLLVGINHRQFNSNQFYFDNQFNGYVFDPSLPTNETIQTERKTNFNTALGIATKYNLNKSTLLHGGVALFNINRPNQGFYGTAIPRDLRFCLHGSADYRFNFDWVLKPSLQWNKQGKYNELLLGSSLMYELSSTNTMYQAVQAGIWWRNKDAFYLTLGGYYQNWFLGLSYDINLSSLVPASNARGGFELSVRYILHRIRISKKPHRICPDYI